MTLAVVQDLPLRRREAVSGKTRTPDVGGFDDRFLDCRELGHLWGPARIGVAQPVEVGSTKARRLAVRGSLGHRHLECGRCTCVREDYVSRRSGELVSRRYTYPEGYLVKGVGRPANNDLRRERFERALGRLREATK